MSHSISYVMEYTTDERSGDKIGGLPTHLPTNWPTCGCCQEFMPFIGQLNKSDRLTLNGNLAIHVYTCLDTRNPHLEVLPPVARENNDGIGISYQDSVQFIRYKPVTDPVDQASYMADIDQYQQLIDKHGHLSADKVDGLFPNDGSDSPLVTPTNRIIAQLSWRPFEGLVYIYYREGYGFYPIRPL